MVIFNNNKNSNWSINLKAQIRITHIMCSQINRNRITKLYQLLLLALVSVFVGWCSTLNALHVTQPRPWKHSRKGYEIKYMKLIDTDKLNVVKAISNFKYKHRYTCSACDKPKSHIPCIEVQRSMRSLRQHFSYIQQATLFCQTILQNSNQYEVHGGITQRNSI